MVGVAWNNVNVHDLSEDQTSMCSAVRYWFYFKQYTYLNIIGYVNLFLNISDISYFRQKNWGAQLSTKFHRAPSQQI